MAATSEKLDTCEVCAAKEAKYTCPKCEVRTCCLACVNIHKKELECDGIRDKTKFIPLNSFTDLDLLSDYRLLEGIGRSVEQFQNDPTKRCTRQQNLPAHLYKLRSAAHHRGVELQFMPHNFSRHRENSTFLNWKTNELFWRVELIFSQAENTKWVIEKVPENKRLSILLEEVLNGEYSTEIKSDNASSHLFLLQNKLKFYRATGLPGLKVFLKAERVRNSDSRFYELDLNSTLQENLRSKTLIEFPTIYVAFKDHSDMFEIIDCDEEIKSKPTRQPVRQLKRRPSFQSKRKSIDNQDKLPKMNVDSSVNYFFNTEVSDSEDENSSERKNYKNNKELQIPDYYELVKME